MAACRLAYTSIISTARAFSVMPVQLYSESKAIKRAVRSPGSLKAGACVEVEFGATWATVQGNGQWWPSTAASD